MTLFVVYVPATGHVVGAIDSIGAPPLPPPDPTTGIVAATPLVGTALQLRVSLGGGEIATVSVPAGELAVHTPDDVSDVLDRPLEFGVELVPGQQPKPALIPLLPWTGGIAFAADGLGLSVTLPRNATQTTTAVAFVTDDQDTRQTSGDIPAGSPDVVLPVFVSEGAHGALVLVAGWVGRLEKVTKP